MKAIIPAIILILLKSPKIFCQDLNKQFKVPATCETSGSVWDVAFARIGRFRGFTDNGAEYQKTYFASKHYKTDWFGAKISCKSFGLELATFETLTEAQTFLNDAYKNQFIKSQDLVHFLIDGMTLTPRSTTDWYWTKNGKKISFDIPWQPGEPNFDFNVEYCLSVWIQDGGAIGFNDGSCQNHTWPYICQRVDYFVPLKAT